MTNLPKIKTKYGEGIGVEIFIQAPDISGNESTFLSADEAAGQTELSVVSGKNFPVDYVLIGNFGEEQAEIVLVSSQSDTVLNVGTTSFAHPRGTKVTHIPYNQIVVERQAAGAGAFSALTAVAIRADSTQTYIQRATDASTDVYKYRFYNFTADKSSAYSDTATASGYADNSVHSIKRRALQDMGEQISDAITDQFLNDSLWEARRELDQDPRVVRWSFRVKMDEDIGNIIPGTYTLALPSDLRDPTSNKNLLSLRVGRDNAPLDYQPKTEFNKNYLDVAHTTLNGAVLAADTSIVLTSSGDFDESGNIYVAAASVAGTIDTVAYTANTESTNTISGVTGIATGGHATGTDVWQGLSFGLPRNYTVDADSGVIKFDVPFADDYAGENVWCDYYSEIPAYDSDGDTLDEPETDLFVHFLRWKIELKKSNGKLKPTESGNYLLWTKGKDDLIKKEYTGQRLEFVPDA